MLIGENSVQSVPKSYSLSVNLLLIVCRSKQQVPVVKIVMICFVATIKHPIKTWATDPICEGMSKPISMVDRRILKRT